MRILLKFTIPAARGSQAIMDGSVGPVLENLLGTINPEAAYFFLLDGKRGGFIVFEMPDPSQVFHVAEPLIQELDAEVDFYPVMIHEDLVKGLGPTTQAGQGAS